MHRGALKRARGDRAETVSARRRSRSAPGQRYLQRVPSWDDRDAVALAILFHDAIYIPGRTDNESRSAELYRAAQRSRS